MENLQFKIQEISENLQSVKKVNKRSKKRKANNKWLENEMFDQEQIKQIQIKYVSQYQIISSKYEDRKENEDNFDLQVKKDNRGNDQYNFVFKTGVQKRNERKQKAKSQKMYLMEAKRDSDDEWQFQVQGFSGCNITQFLTQKDFPVVVLIFRKGKNVVNIFFSQFLESLSKELLDLMKCNPVLKAGRFQILDENLKQRLEERIKQEPTFQEINNFDKEKLGVEKDCVICFEELETKDLTQCSICQKYIHQSCIIEWTKKNDTCPLCRQRWQIQKGDTTDAFSKLKKIKI